MTGVVEPLGNDPVATARLHKVRTGSGSDRVETHAQFVTFFQYGKIL